MSPHVMRWLTDRGYIAYAEVPVNSGCIDIVGVKGQFLISVEMKTAMTYKLVKQALLNQLVVDLSFVAIPTGPRGNVCPPDGVGVLVVANGSVRVLHRAKLWKRGPFAAEKRAMLERLAFMEPGGIAGFPCISMRDHASAVQQLEKVIG